MKEALLAAENSVDIMQKLHVNWLLIVVLVIIIAGIVTGAVKGAFKMIFTVVAIVIAISFTIIISPVVKAKMLNSPKIYNFFYQKTESIAEKNNWAKTISKMLEDKEEKPESSGADSVKLLEDALDTMGVPEKFKESVIGDESVIRNMEISSDADANEQAESIQKGAYTGVTNVVVKAVAFLTTLFIVGIVLALLGGITDLLGKIPCVDKVNAIVGAMAGGLIGLVIVWIIFAVATMLSATVFGQKIITLISEKHLLSFIYNHNYNTTRILS